MGGIGFLIGIVLVFALKLGWLGIFVPFICAALFQKFFPKIANKSKSDNLFFRTTFEVIGRLSKAKGVVTHQDIQSANQVMNMMGLNQSARELAQAAFRRGKQGNYPLQQKVMQLRQAYAHSPHLLQLFLDIQIQVSLSDGVIHQNERAILYTIAQIFGISHSDFENILRQASYQFSSGYAYQQNHSYRNHQSARSTVKLRDCYALLNVKETDDPQTIKRAYRKLMSQYHPDKLVSKGLPPEMIEVAKRKAQEIQAAYESIKQAQGFP